MAQLKEDEWPKDGEPTTSEQEGDTFKREGPNPPTKNTGRGTDEMNKAAYDSIISNVEPDQQPTDEGPARAGPPVQPTPHLI